jgi:phosphatidylserine/phosphatidylglycerophosphate/cardiolipin synthase-like enzyme
MQFFGTREALREAVGAPGWTTFFDNRIRERLLECRTGTDIELSMLQPIVPYLEGRSPEERERQASYLIVGSHNMDLRSFFLDGEAIGIVAGAGALLSVGDLLVLSTVGVEWVTGPEDIDENFPHVGNTKAAAARALEAIF